MSVDNYDWPDLGDNWGKCEGCGLRHPLKGNLCKGCTWDMKVEELFDDKMTQENLEDVESAMIDAAYEAGRDGAGV